MTFKQKLSEPSFFKNKKTMKLLHHTLVFTVLLMTAIFFSACSISDKVNNSSYHQDLGQGTGSNIAEATEKVLYRYSYTIYKTDRTDNQIRYETDWNIRLPFQSESALGYQEARTKIVIQARPYMRTELSYNRLYNVQFTGITEYRKEGEDSWSEFDSDKEANVFLKEIAYELKTELERVLYQ